MLYIDENLESKDVIVDAFDPILRTPAELYDFANPQVDLENLRRVMTKVAEEYGTFGISAPQIGVPYKISLFPNKQGERRFIINPQIVYYGAERTTYREGSINFIGLACKVSRAATVRARFQCDQGRTTTEIFDQNLSNALQQAVDQLNGIIFYQKAGFFDRQKALREWKQLYRKQQKAVLSS